MSTNTSPTVYALINEGVVQYLMAERPPFADAPDILVVAGPASLGIKEGWSYDPTSETFTAPAEPEIDLATLKVALKTQVDIDAESLRLTLITPGSGQAMEYQEAYAQAQAALAATDVVKPSKYPMLAATIGVDFDPDTKKPATDVLGVARSVKAAYEAYLLAGAAIRGARLLAKAEIEAAGDADQARAVFAAIKWPAFA